MSDLYEKTYNPDVLSCLANLSNDEVFTPPDVANQMLDMLPESIWSDPEATFLDPACKSGVFLREMAKRLDKGLEPVIPDREERVDHIFKNQLFGIAITELTSLLSRRSVYCSKYPNCKYSIVEFDVAEGNIRYRRCEHTWAGEKCRYCGASKSEYDRDDSLETHAYEFIHANDLKDMLPMKFDVIVGNPPYQLSDGGNNASASPIYQLFVQQAKKLLPRYLTMIIPSRYFAGGKGLNAFRDEMLNDRHVRKIVDYINAKDCFPQNSVGGGVNYFLWDRDHPGDCEITTVRGASHNLAIRALNEFPVFVRHNQAVSVIHKVNRLVSSSLADVVSSRNPFGYPTSYRGEDEAHSSSDLHLYSSKGTSYVGQATCEKGSQYLNKWKVMLSRIIYEHACEPDKDGKMRVLSKIEVLAPQDVCTDSYLVLGPFGTEAEANNLVKYLRTKFARFLIAQTLSSINLSKDKFQFVPMLDFGKEWSDDELNVRFGLSDEETSFIDSLIHEMPGEE